MAEGATVAAWAELPTIAANAIAAANTYFILALANEIPFHELLYTDQYKITR
jgi:hypothetical protein